VFSFVGKALYDGYNVLLASPGYILTGSIEDLVGAATKTDFLYLRSRGRTFHFVNAMAELLKADLRADHVAPYSWREQELIEAAFVRVKDATVKNTPKYGELSREKGFARFRPTSLGVHLAAVGAQWLPLAEPNCSVIHEAYSRWTPVAAQA
jgi:hypothetical protein